MHSMQTPILNKNSSETNQSGYFPKDYLGGPSTLCGGCGHDAISFAISQACFETHIPPHHFVKFSGIGCSSKTVGYFLKKSHGLNGVHGRMPPFATGAYLSNHQLNYICVSGDGDSGSIGLGHFLHAVRKQINVCYILMNNGVYGLTKGQFSATASIDASNKNGDINQLAPINLMSLAILNNAAFVARGFSANKPHLISLIKEAIATPGFSFIDVLSPCVTFNHHAQSELTYPNIQAKMKNVDHDPTQQQRALHATLEGTFQTGVFFTNPHAQTLAAQQRLSATPLRDLQTRPSSFTAPIRKKLLDFYR